MSTPIPNNEASFALAEIATETRGQLLGGAGDARVVGVAIDSRAVRPGGLFVAIRGASQDGSRFVPDAIAAGARAVLVQPDMPCPASIARVEVADTARALGDLAAHHRRRWGGRVVAITGSAGKTTTKELTAAVLARAGARVLKTLGNLNNQFGMPMMLFCAGAAHDTAVLELGTGGPGEIARLGAIAAPDVGTVLLAAVAHTEGLGSLSAVADEKASLWNTLGARGVQVVNADDPALVLRLRRDLAVLSFGSGEQASVRLLASELRLDGTRARVGVQGVGELELRLRLIGHAAAIDACAAIASALALRTAEPRACIEAAALALAEVEPAPGRMVCTPTRAGVTICDDSYNANPRSMALGLETLKALAHETGGRSVAVLGDMKELGGLSQAEHTRLGELAVRLGIDALVGCGPEMAHATSAAARLAAGRLAPHPTRVAHTLSALDGAPIAHSLCRKGDVVLVKGSRSMAMERVVAALQAKFGGGA